MMPFEDGSSTPDKGIHYGFKERGIGVRFPAGATDFYLLRGVKIGIGAHLVSYTVSTEDCFLGVKAEGIESDHSPPSSDEERMVFSCCV
jgi:hypothetical protein